MIYVHFWDHSCIVHVSVSRETCVAQMSRENKKEKRLLFDETIWCLFSEEEELSDTKTETEWVSEYESKRE